MSDYPEHDKLHKIAKDSQRIGEFLDFGLPAQGLTLYEQRFYDCDCTACEEGEAEASEIHQIQVKKDEGRFRDGKWQYAQMSPTHKTIKQILAEHFDIDQDKLDAEANEMLDSLRSKDSV